MHVSEEFKYNTCASTEIKDTQMIFEDKEKESKSKSKHRHYKRGILQVTTHLLKLYKKCCPSYRYNVSMKPHRILTEIPENCFEFSNNGYDLPNGDYIIRKEDIIISPEGTEYLIEDLIGKGTFGQVVK
mmetsp:Transcript_1458/g.1697  ORF Transcript_1458/g.1697 Transcript_1458/m.1697 type:complete len:129 (-) Transcript_1458:79-465(-)